MGKLSAEIVRHLKKIAGKENVLTDEVSLALYAYDCSVSRSSPDGVILIKTADILPKLVSFLYQQHIPFIARASATNHAGSCAALHGGILLNMAPLNHILEINTKESYAWVESGVVTGRLQQALDPFGFFYAPDPASERVCTLGGNFIQNASGARCLKYGNTAAHVLEAEVILPTGEILTLTPSNSVGNLLGLLSGSEGTLGLVTRLKVKILPKPAHIKTFLVTFSSLEKSIQTVTDLVAQGILPRCVEAMDKTTTVSVEAFTHAGYPTEAEALLIFELDGNTQQIAQDEEQLQKICLKNGALDFIVAQNEEERQRLWRGRRAAYSAMARLAPNVMVGDGTVPPQELPRALEKIRTILAEENIQASMLFHAGDGNFHPQLIFDERRKPDVVQIKKIIKKILQVCVDCCGTISGEHGIGVEKRALMAYQYTADTLSLMSKIKHATDPLQLANPLKIIPLDYEEKARIEKTAPFLTPFISALQQAVTPLQITGANSQLMTSGTKEILSSLSLNRITDIDTANYTVTVQAGMLVSDLLQTLQMRNLFCILPPTKGTVGGLVASGCAPGIYPHILGIEALLADGSFITYGGKLMKNAAGYNLIRLFAGSQGKYGLITQLTLRIFTTPQAVVKQMPFCHVTLNAWSEKLKKELDPRGILL